MLHSGTTIAICGLLAAGVLCCQQPGPLFRAGSKLVEVEVTVLDKKGNPVTGLAPADFTLWDEGKPQSIAFFHFDGVAEPPAAKAPSPSPAERHSGSLVFSNRAGPGSESPNVTALVLDGLNTPPEQSMVARSQAMRYLQALTPQTRMAIFYMGQQSLQILHDFTGDAAALRDQLAKAVVGIPTENVTDYARSIEEEQAFVNMFPGPMQGLVKASMERQLEAESAANSAARRSRMERSLDTLETLGRHLAAIPGRKSLVWIGAGFSLVSVSAKGQAPYSLNDDFESKIREVARRLAQDGVVLYIVDSRGLPGAPYGGGPEVGHRGGFGSLQQAEGINNDPHAAMSLMASVTGGRYLFNTNDLLSGFQQAVVDVRGSYRLGFYAPEEQQGQWHKLKVQVKQSGVTVRHREGYRTDSAAAQPAAWTEESWRSAMTNPLGSSVIPLTVSYSAAPAGERVLDLAVGVEGIYFRREGEDFKADLEIAASELTADGQPLPAWTAKLPVSVPAAKWQEASQAGIPFRRQWTPAAAAARTRVVVLDVATGQYGSVDIQAR